MKITLNIILKLLTMTLILNSHVAEEVFAIQKPDKQQLVGKLLELEHAEEKAQIMIGQFIELVKKKKSAVPNAAWQNIQQRIDAKAYIGKLKPVYNKYYTESQLQNLIQYYQKPSGQLPVKPTPEMEKELYEVSNTYGKEVGQFISGELKKMGY